MKIINEVTITFPSKSTNEGYARSAVAAFAAQLDPTLEEISERLKNTLKELEKIDDKFYLMISLTKTTDEEAENYNKLTTIILLLRELTNE